jgi:hypothetical protein
VSLADQRLDIDYSALEEPNLVIQEITTFLNNNYQSRVTQQKVSKIIKHIKSSITSKMNKEQRKLIGVLPYYDLIERGSVTSPDLDLEYL